MGRFSIPEEIIGVPLWVPDAHNYFEVEDAAMPNGDPCLVMRGDISTAYKAFLKAPTLSPINIFGSSDTVVPREWSMSTWLKLTNLASAGSDAPMFGCTTRDASSIMPAGSGGNQNVALMVRQDTTVNGFQVYRDTLNNSGGASNQAISISSQTGNNGWHMFQDYWFLFVVNFVSSFSSPNYTVTGSVYMDTYGSAQITHASGGTAASGVYGSPLYLHIGSYQTASASRGGIWRMAKWAFHDHVLSQAERIQMWQGMYGADHVYLDDFNRAGIGTNWRAQAGGGLSIVSDEVKAADATTYKSVWVKDLGTPNIYSEIIATEISAGWARANVRNTNYAANIDCYTGGWSQSGTQWAIARTVVGGETSLVSTGSGPPSFPCTIRLESEDNAGDVDLRLYVNGVLKLSHTDSTGSKLLNRSNAGMEIRGNAGQNTRVNNFECGTL